MKNSLDAGSTFVQIKVSYDGGPRKKFGIKVTDNGRGIEESTLKEIGNRYYNLHINKITLANYPLPFVPEYSVMLRNSILPMNIF